MIYTVVWKPDAHAELVDIWISARNRQAVTDAANRVDQLLKIARTNKENLETVRYGYCLWSLSA